MIDPSIKQIILDRLRIAEQEHDVRILYACESGSRAWGFPSPDSDYDVRFIYAHPQSWYLSYDVEKRRDVIEYPIVDEIDCGGWDLKKALQLFAKTNGPLCEWLKSPIQYVVYKGFHERLLELEPNTINLTGLFYRYLSLATGTLKKGLVEQDQRNLKRYCYVLRSLLAIRYIEKTRGAPPTEFQKLVDCCAPKSLLASIEELMQLKVRSKESALGKPLLNIDQFIEEELARVTADNFVPPSSPAQDQEITVDALNQLFREYLQDKSASSLA